MMEQEKTEAAGSVTAGPGLLVTTAALRWQKAVAEALGLLDLTYVQYLLLHGVVALQGDNPVSQVEVAEYCGTDAMLASKHLRALESKGLILRHRHPTDTRARALEVTPHGVVCLDTAALAVGRVDARMFGDTEQADRIRHDLMKVVNW